MQIRRVSVQNIRCHSEKAIDLRSDTTVLVGKNGAGKTSLLEAVYIALRGSSFKGTDMDVLKKDAPWWRIDLHLEDDTTRTVTFDPSRASGKKQFTIHDKKSFRLHQKDKYPVVLFEPEDLRLLHGSPSRRRAFIDHIITQLDPTYTTTLRRYERALKQRNSVLKREYSTNDDVFVWNVALSEYGATIIEKRMYAAEMLNKTLSQYYNDIAGTGDDVTVHYSHTLIHHSVQKLLRELETKLAYDKVTGHTSVGPHRHDITFAFNGSPALSVASRGEVRTVILAVKQTEIELITRLTGEKPMVLLDDVFSDLDETRRQNGVVRGSQIVITTTAAHDSDTLSLAI